jgi:phosphonate transport system substrate-binding protein
MRLLSCLALIALLALSTPATLARDHLVVVFQKQKDPAALQASAQRLGELLGQELSQRVEVKVPLDYSASVQALVSGQADAAYISSLPFLLARRDGGAQLLLVEQRADARGTARTDYDSIFVVPADSPLRDFADLKREARTLRMAFTSPTSTSGYVFPLKRFVAEGMIPAGNDGRAAFREVRFGGGYTQALQEVLAGRADVAAVSDYVLEGPAADTYLPAAERARLRILARTPGVPTHLVAVRGGLEPALKARLKAALQAVAAREPALVRDVYGATRFVEANEDAHVRAAIEAIEASGLPIENLAR